MSDWIDSEEPTAPSHSWSRVAVSLLLPSKNPGGTTFSSEMEPVMYALSPITGLPEA